MSGLIMAAQLILALSLLVFIHELGHFLAARAFGIRCDKFYIFFDAFGKKLWSKKIGGTEYGIGWLPLGGYVKIAGMIDESMDKDQMDLPPEPDEFRSKPAWQRFIVMIGGIVFNVILGIIVFTGLLKFGFKEYTDPASFGQGIVANELGEQFGFQDGDIPIAINGEPAVRWKDLVSPGIRFGADITVKRGGEELTIIVPDTLYSERRQIFGRYGDVEVQDVVATSFKEKPKLLRALFENLGLMEPIVFPEGVDNTAVLKKGDKVLAVNGQQVDNFSDMSDFLGHHKNKTVSLQVERDGQKQDLRVKSDSIGRIGVMVDSKVTDTDVKKPYTTGQAFKYAVKEGWETIYFNAKGFALIFAGKIPFLESVQSPIGIAKFFGPTWDWLRFWYLTGLISLVLAFMNILPIPALDGGHMLFILIELIIGRPLSDTFLERAQMLGMLILIPFMLLILGKDILGLLI